MFVNVTPSPVSRCHCTVRGAAPVVATENRTRPPSPTVALTGWRVMTIGCAGSFGGGAPLRRASSTAFKKILCPVGVNVSRPVYIGIAFGADEPSRVPPANHIR